MGSTRVFFRIIVFCLHLFIAFVLVVKMTEHDITGSWLRLLVFSLVCLLLAGSVVWHGIRFYHFIKATAQ